PSQDAPSFMSSLNVSFFGWNQDQNVTANAPNKKYASVDGDDPSDPIDTIEKDDDVVKFIDDKEQSEKNADDEAEQALMDAENAAEAGSNIAAPNVSLYGMASYSTPDAVFGSDALVGSSMPSATWACTPSGASGSYDASNDFQCRLLSLREYLRAHKRPLEEAPYLSGRDAFEVPQATQVDRYDPKADYQSRLNIYYGLHSDE
ncbi:MAG: hypothetical protein EBS08_06075, partial [Cytophagia bacterium]|nr:hypothetical protein [Cytophagia bacterium]